MVGGKGRGAEREEKGVGHHWPRPLPIPPKQVGLRHCHVLITPPRQVAVIDPTRPMVLTINLKQCVRMPCILLQRQHLTHRFREMARTMGSWARHSCLVVLDLVL